MKPGEIKNIQTNFIPKEAKKYDCSVKVSLVDVEENNLDDNEVEFSIGYSDVSLDRLYISNVDEKTMLNMIITNNSDINPDTIEIVVKEGDKDGNVLLSKVINNEDKEEYIESMELDVENMIFDVNREKVLYVEISTDKKEKYLYNNSSYIIVDKEYDKEDVNKDGNVDIIDLALDASKYNLTQYEKGWNYKYDINLDGMVDIFDIVAIGRRVI